MIKIKISQDIENTLLSLGVEVIDLGTINGQLRGELEWDMI